MQLAIDLTPRQAGRVLEQALRAQADLEIEPRNLPGEELLRGKVLGREGELLCVQVLDEQLPLPLGALIGAFCELRMVLSGEMYLFATCIYDALETPEPGRVFLAIPEVIQVANRRHFERTNATVASQIRIWVSGNETPFVGLLADVSAEGLACNLPGAALDKSVSLGDELRVSFELAGFDEMFDLPASVCNKSLSKDQHMLLLGLKFSVGPDDAVAQHALQRVRAVLFELTTNLSDMDSDL
jgi:hypothetical protein